MAIQPLSTFLKTTFTFALPVLFAILSVSSFNRVSRLPELMQCLAEWLTVWQSYEKKCLCTVPTQRYKRQGPMTLCKITFVLKIGDLWHLNLTRAFIETPPGKCNRPLKKWNYILFFYYSSLYINVYEKNNKINTRSFGASREKLLQVTAVFQFSLQKKPTKNWHFAGQRSFESTCVSL